MKTVYPSYYREFHCIADACRHSCCVGWDIEIDEDTAELYRSLSGPFGDRLRAHIDLRETPCFRMDRQGRCPFLDRRGLCEIIKNLGDGALCDICAEHPRFYNVFDERTEVGLGLCCEEAARLILGQSRPTVLLSDGEESVTPEAVTMRDRAIALLQQRELSLRQRVQNVLELYGARLPEDERALLPLLLSLERMDERFGELLRLWQETTDSIDTAAFDCYMQDRQTEYEQLLVYLVYRHLSEEEGAYPLAVRAAFAVFCYRLLYKLGATIWNAEGEFPFEQQVELARLFSSEIEYSDQNPQALMQALAF